jgi:hypothetical protein
MNAKQLSRAKNILSGDDVESQIAHILNHRNPHEMIDYIDGVQPSEDYEYFYTVREFLMTIGMDDEPSDVKKELIKIIALIELNYSSAWNEALSDTSDVVVIEDKDDVKYNGWLDKLMNLKDSL